MWIEKLVGLTQNHWPFEVAIPVGYVGWMGVARSGIIRANQRREREPTLSREDTVPLPASDQLVHDPAGAASEAPPAAKRQRGDEVRVETGGKAIRRRAPVQEEIVGTKDIRRLIFAGRRQDGRIQIQHFRVAVIGLETEPARDTLDEGNIQRMIAAGPLIDPGRGVGHIGIRALLQGDAVYYHGRRGRQVERSLWHGARLTFWKNTTAETSLLSLAHLGLGRVGVHRKIRMIGLAAYVARLKHQICGELAFHGEGPHLDGWRKHIR